MVPNCVFRVSIESISRVLYADLVRQIRQVFRLWRDHRDGIRAVSHAHSACDSLR
jgi:hypothetical protein